MTIILVIIGIVSLLAYASVLVNVPLFFVYPLSMLVISVITVVILSALGKIKFTSEQDIWIAKGIRADEENKKKNEFAEREAKQRQIDARKKELSDYRKELDKEKERLALYEAKLNLMDVLAKEDMDLKTVNFIIKQIETRRANSVTEALHQYDAHTEKQREIESKWRHDMFMAEMQRQQDADRRLREAEEHMRQTFHNLEMQKQARRAVNELEEINKKLKDLED